MRLICSPCEAEHCPSGVRIPVRSAKASKRRYHIYTITVRHRQSNTLSIRRTVDELRLIPEPLDGRSSHEHTSLKRIADFSVKSYGYGGEESLLRVNCLIPRIHEEETTCSVGVLHITGLKAALSEQRSLLISGNSRYRHLTAKYLSVRVSVYLTRISHCRKHALRDVELCKQFPVPLQCMNVE